MDPGEEANSNGNRATADEATPLVAAADAAAGSSTSATTDATDPSQRDGRRQESIASQRLWDELDQPWPSTFERSIGLLASPMHKPDQVDRMTRSPKPGSTPQALQRRRNLDRGFYTPKNAAHRHDAWAESKSNSMSARGTEISDLYKNASLSARSGDVQQDLGKVKIADMKLDNEAIDKLMAKQKAKADKVGEYRANILKQQQQQQQQQKQDVETGKTKKPIGAEAGEHGEKPQVEPDSTVAQCVFNFVNMLLGVGILGLPFACKAAGYFGGIFCLAAFGLITWRTSILIGRELNGDPRPVSQFDDSPYKTPLPPGSAPEARMLPPISSFPQIARAAFGNTGCIILSVVLYFELYACLCIFLIALADHLHAIFPAISMHQFLVIGAALNAIPTVLLRTPALLSYLSFLGMVSTICVCVSVAVAAFWEGDMSPEIAAEMQQNPEQPYHVYWNTSGIFLGFGLTAYCFSGHAIVPSIYASMIRPQKFEAMVTWTYVVVVFTCALIGLGGYYMFGDFVLDQVTLSLEAHSKAGAIMKILTWLMILTVYSKLTTFMFPLALGTEEIVAPYLTSDWAVLVASTAIKLSWLVLAVVVALFVPSFSFLCAIVGMVCTMTVSVIFPAAAHLKMFGPTLNWWEKSLDFLFIFIGVVMAIVGTALEVS